MDSFKAAFESFMAEDFEDACVSSTEASWNGSGYSVELFEDGSYRVLWDNQIGNLYDSPGIILGIPGLSDDEWGDGEETFHCFDNAQKAMKDAFQMYEVYLENCKA